MDDTPDAGAAPAAAADAADAADGAEPAAKRAKVVKATPADGHHVVAPAHAAGVPPPPVGAVIFSDEGSKAVVDPESGLDGHVYEKDGEIFEATMAKVCSEQR